MTGIDELVRDALAADASTHEVIGDLAERSAAAGRSIRRRRRTGLVAASMLSVAAVVVGSLAATGAFTPTTKAQVIVPASNNGPGSNDATSPPPVHAVPAWSTWPKDRVYGTKPGAGFFSDVPSDAYLLGSGTLPDGMQFRFAAQPGDRYPVTDVAGFGDHPEWGDEPQAGSSLLSDRAPYFGYEFMTSATYDNGAEDGDTYWVVIVGQPNTTDAEYSEDGITWQPMHIENGIAVIKRTWHNAGIPSTARLHLEDSDGTYYDGPVNLL